MSAYRRMVGVRPRHAMAAMLGITALVGASGAGSAAAEDSSTNSYSLSVVATSVETLVQSKSLPVIGISGSLQVATFGASAGLSSVGDSVAEAGVPFSPFVSSLPGTVAGLVGPGLPKIPTLPGFVSSSFPDRPTKSSSQVGFSVKATSSANMSQGTAGLGTTSPGTGNDTAFANAKTVVNDDGSVSATGSTGVDLLNFGPLFDIGNVTTTATIDISKAGKIAYKGNSQLGTITLLNLPTGLSLSGLNLLGVGIPIPLKANLDTVNSLLKPLGVTVRLLDADFAYTDGSTSSGDAPDPAKSLKSVTTAGLSVAVEQNVPTQGVVTVTEILGRAIVTATNRPDATAGGAPGTLPPGTGEPTSGGDGVPAAPLPTGDGTPLVPDGLPSLSNSGDDGLAGNGTPLTPIPELAPGADTGQAQVELMAVRAAKMSNSGEGPYLVLVLAGLLAVLGSLLIRVTAVRLMFFKR